MKSRLLGVVCASIITLATSVNATPITLDFTGVITANSDFTNSVPYGVGTSFSGYVTYDVDNAETVSFQETNPGNTSGFASSNSGCVQYDNGVCTIDRGTDTPVVIDYQFNWIGGDVLPWEYSLDFQDSSRRGNIFDIPPAPITGEGWDVQRNQFRIDNVGDLANFNYTATVIQRSFSLLAYSNDDTLLSGPIDDFVQGFNADVLFLNGVSRQIDLVDFVSVETCVAINDCTTVYNAGSYHLVGELTSARFSAVPIPPALYLFGSGLIGLVGAARRKVI